MEETGPCGSFSGLGVTPKLCSGTRWLLIKKRCHHSLESVPASFDTCCCFGIVQDLSMPEASCNLFSLGWDSLWPGDENRHKTENDLDECVSRRKVERPGD